MKLTNKILNNRLTKVEKLNVMYTHDLASALEKHTQYYDHLQILNFLLWDGYTPQEVLDVDRLVIEDMREEQRLEEYEYERDQVLNGGVYYE